VSHLLRRLRRTFGAKLPESADPLVFWVTVLVDVTPWSEIQAMRWQRRGVHHHAVALAKRHAALAIAHATVPGL